MTIQATPLVESSYMPLFEDWPNWLRDWAEGVECAAHGGIDAVEVIPNDVRRACNLIQVSCMNKGKTFLFYVDGRKYRGR